MKSPILYFLLILSITIQGSWAQIPRTMLHVSSTGKGKINPMVDNIGYWNRMVKLGYVIPTPPRTTPPPAAQFTGTILHLYTNPVNTPSSIQHPASSIQHPVSSIQHPVSSIQHPASSIQHPASILPPQNSPDIPVTGETDVTQSENSVFIDPSDEFTLLNSNNSSSWISGYAQDPYGADALWSLDEGETWKGSTDGVNGNNSGDPSTAIGLNGWWYVGRITADNGQAVSYSKDQGKSWKRIKVGQGPTAGYGLLDKNHLWIDNSPASPFKGYLYDAWTNFIPGSSDTNQIQIVRSADQGISWTSPFNISAGASAQKLNHGVNIHTGPDGEVYLVWSIYDTWPSDETAIGFTKSIDGGAVFTPATRIISNIKGIRASLTGKNMRVHSFPSMAVDNSTGPHRGTIYIVWSNVGYPGINTGSDIDIYLIRSNDEGETWSAPVKVNQDPSGLGKQHYFPWICCDPVTGGLCVVYYDDRNLGSAEAATFVSFSYDGGLSWSDLQVSDYTFTPDPIPGLAFSYFGDYIGIQSNNMKVYPVWTDNHEVGRAMSYVSPFDLGPNPNQPWLTYHSDSLAPVLGTGPATMNNGDSLFLSLGLKNTGDQTAMELVATISSPSPYILLTDSTAGYGTMAAGEVKIEPNGFTFKVSDTIPDNLPVRFNVRVNGSDSVWYSHFALESHAPDLRITGLTIVDTLGGNRNGRMDPGETVKIVVGISNTGDFTSQQTSALISTLSPYLTLLSDSVYLGDILPGDSKAPVYTVTVDPTTPMGAGADLNCLVKSGFYRKNRSFRQVIGLLAEDWETNTFTRFPWQAAGLKPWTITTQDPWEGVYCSRSGVISDYQNSQLFLTYTSATNDSISFYVKTSSEQDYDYLMFSIDAVWQGQWSGNTSWTRVAFPVSAGTHTFKWIYLKDLSFAWGQDCAWIDFIALPAPVLPVVDPGANDTVCAGTAAHLMASATQVDSIRWSTTGDGAFSSDTSLISTYLHGSADLAAGSVALRLTGYGQFGSAMAEKHLKINPLPVCNITSFPADSVCAGQTIELSADTTGILSFLWSPGNYNTPSILYDTANSGGPGMHQVKLTAISRFHCVNHDSLTILFRDCTGIGEEIPSFTLLYPNPNKGRFIVQLNHAENGPVKISVTDLSGNSVFRESVTHHAGPWSKIVDLPNLPGGVYIFTLESRDQTHTAKFEIQK